MDGAGIKPLTSQLRDHNCTTEPQLPVSNSGMAAKREEPTEPRRVVILGKTGYGKSSFANTIFGETLFKVNHTFESETTKCRAETKAVNGRSITLIDTPGFFDTNISEKDLRPEIVRCITECAPGPHAFLIVLKVEKYTKHEQAVIDTIEKYFSEEILKYAVVIFTHGDQLQSGQTIKDIVQKNESLSDLVKKCGGRCHVIDNKYWNKAGDVQKKEYQSNEFQVKELLETLDKMVDEHNGGYYTNDTLQEVEQEIQQEEEQIRQSSTNMSKEEIREKAKDKVFEKLLIRLTGTATGALLGALLGVATLTLFLQNNMLAASGPFVTAGAGVMGFAALTVGGTLGYHASEGADTPQEAAKMAVEAVVDVVKTVIVKTSDVSDKVSQKKNEHDSVY